MAAKERCIMKYAQMVYKEINKPLFLVHYANPTLYTTWPYPQKDALRYEQIVS